MEIMHYYRALRRKWIFLLIVPALVTLFVAYQFLQYDPTYTASARVTVTRAPQQIETEDYRYNEYYLYLASEFMLDDMVELVQGNVFARDIIQILNDEYEIELTIENIEEIIHANRLHRILSIQTVHPEQDIALAVSYAAIQLLEDKGTEYFFNDEQGERSALIEPVDVPEEAMSTEQRDRLLLLMQIAAAAIAGAFLALFLDYLDDSLHNSEATERALDIPVLTSIPKES